MIGFIGCFGFMIVSSLLGRAGGLSFTQSFLVSLTAGVGGMFMGMA